MCGLCDVPLEELIGFELRHADPAGPAPPAPAERKAARALQLKGLIRRFEEGLRRVPCRISRSQLDELYKEQYELSRSFP